MEEKESDGNVINMYPGQTVSQVIPKGRIAGFAIKAIKITLALLLLVAVSSISYYLGRASILKQVNKFSLLTNPQSPVFADIKGSLAGKIVKVDGNKAYIETSKGGRGIFNILEKLPVSEIDNGKLKELSDNPEGIRLNEDAVIQIIGTNNGYSINSITYIKNTLPTIEISKPNEASGSSTTNP